MVSFEAKRNIIVIAAIVILLIIIVIIIILLLRRRSRPACAKPNSPSSIVISTGSHLRYKAIISWNEVTGAKSYAVYRKSSAGITKNEYNERKVTTNSSIIFDSLDSPTQYFRISAINNCGEGGLSVERSAQIYCVLDPPGGLDVQPIQSTNAKATWNSIAGAIQYHLYRNDQKVWSGTSTSAEFSTPTPGDYSIQVSSQNNCGESDKSQIVTYNVPLLFI